MSSDLVTKYIFCDKHNTLMDHISTMGMLTYVVANIYVVFGDQVFQHSVGILVGTNCVPLMTDLFLYQYET
jgi:hypothetical protein